MRTTTGFVTADYELWPQSAQMFLYMVCFVGACAGSTTSGIEIVHDVIICKVIICKVIICKFMSAAVKKIFFQTAISAIIPQCIPIAATAHSQPSRLWRRVRGAPSSANRDIRLPGTSSRGCWYAHRAA